jgi:hypothetical protein
MKLCCLKCETNYEKPDWFAAEKNVFFRWSVTYCDKCRKEKETDALNALPSVVEALSK